MEGISLSHFEIVLIEVVGIVCHLPDLFAYLSILRIVVPGSEGRILHLMRIGSIENTPINYLLML